MNESIMNKIKIDKINLKLIYFGRNLLYGQILFTNNSELF